MKSTGLKRVFAAAVLAATVAVIAAPFASGGESALSGAVKRLTRGSKWRLTQTIPLKFPSGHPQGLVRINDEFYVSTVEIITPTKRYPELRDGYDRDAGEGRGYLVKFDKNGELLEKVELGEGAAYHPGGIDYDGEFIWVPVAEYRPNSASIIYKVNPRSMKAEKVFSYRDHIGGIVHDTENGALHGVSWGSRRFYRWPLDARGSVGDAETPREKLLVPNPSHYIDYQDAHYIGNGEMLCSGLNAYNVMNTVNFRLGGIEIVDLKRNAPIFQIPIEHWSPKTGKPMTQNPFWMDERDGKITAYFIPDDDDSAMYVYEVTP